MHRRGFLLKGAGTASACAAFLAAAGKGATLVVKVNYTGVGTVDDGHKIAVALWDSPAFMKSGSNAERPLMTKTVHTKSASATFDDVQKSSVYISFAYDPEGKWDANSPVPAGASLGLYSKSPGVPEPVALAPGKSTTISATFDDTYKKIA